MKQLLLLLTITMATLTANAQAKIYDAYNLKARTTLQLGNKTITEITDDTVMGNKYQAKIMSEWATKKAIENALQGLGVDTNVLATRLRLYKVKDSLNTIINGKLSIADTTNKWIAKSHTVNNISNGTGFLKNNGSGTWSWDNSTYMIGSGAANRVAYYNGSNSITSNSSFTFDGINLSTPKLTGTGGGIPNISEPIGFNVQSSGKFNMLYTEWSNAYGLAFNAKANSSYTNGHVYTTGNTISTSNNKRAGMITYRGDIGFLVQLSQSPSNIGDTLIWNNILEVREGGIVVNGTLKVGAYTLPSVDGTSSQVLKTNGSGSLSWQNDNGISLTSLSASSPLSYNNGTGAFSISQANTSTNGYLSSTDWNTFNNKQAALGFTPENIANKKTTLADNSDTYYPTQKAVKTAVDAKQDIITGGASSITSSNLTTDRALMSDGSGKVATSSVTATELGYVGGVTSSIQTQLNSKLNAANSNVKRYIRVNATTNGSNYAMDGTKEVVLIDYTDQCDVTLPAVSSLPDGSVFEIQFYNWSSLGITISVYPEGGNSEEIDAGNGIASPRSSILFRSNNQANTVTPLSLRIMWMEDDNIWTVLQGGVFDY